MSAREQVAKAIFEATYPGWAWEQLAVVHLEEWGRVADAAMAAFTPELKDRLDHGEGRQPSAYDEDEHFPWWYMEGGVLCACGDPMDSQERCALMRAYAAGRSDLVAEFRVAADPSVEGIWRDAVDLLERTAQEISS